MLGRNCGQIADRQSRLGAGRQTRCSGQTDSHGAANRHIDTAWRGDRRGAAADRTRRCGQTFSRHWGRTDRQTRRGGRTFSRHWGRTDGAAERQTRRGGRPDTVRRPTFSQAGGGRKLLLVLLLGLPGIRGRGRHCIRIVLTTAEVLSQFYVPWGRTLLGHNGIGAGEGLSAAQAKNSVGVGRLRAVMG